MSNFKSVDTSNYKMRNNVQAAADLNLRQYYADELNAQRHANLSKTRPL